MQAAPSMSSSPGHQEPGVVEDEDDLFEKSLQELKALPSQLRYAADYCEKSFMKTRQKKMVLENTKEYICRAIVTVVDHLGSISANLQFQLSENTEMSNTELRLNCLKQRILTAQDYAQKHALSKLCRSENFPRYNKHYVFPTFKNQCGDVDDSVVSKTKLKYTSEGEKNGSELLNEYLNKRSLRNLSAFEIGERKFNTCSSSGVTLSSVFPFRDNTFVVSIPRNPSFYFQETKKSGRNERSRRMLQIPWRSKRTV